jgi:SAM-dependent methyltransferase
MSAPLSAEEADGFRAFERRRHDELAESYREFFSPITALSIAPLLAAARLQRDSSLLDVATGPGHVAAEGRRLGARCDGVDLSARMIELAKRTCPDVAFQMADVERLPFADASFDAVVCNFGLGHFPSPEASVAECVRTLKKGCRIALSWWDEPGRQRLQGLFREAIQEVGVNPPPEVPTGYSMFRFSDSGEFHRLLEGARLTDVVVEPYETSYLIPDFDTLWRGGLGSFAVTGSTVAHQNPATQAAIRHALQRRAEIYQDSSGFNLPVAFKIGSGEK